MTPAIDIAPLFSGPSPKRDAVDAAIMEAAGDLGFLSVTGGPGAALIAPEGRAALKSIFDVPEAVKRRLMRVNFNPANKAVIRGWYPLQPGVRSYKEGIDMGPDLARPQPESDDPLREPTPLPTEEEAPGWRNVAAEYYVTMETIGAALMRSAARGLGLAEDVFAPLFEEGISSFRLAHYPPRTPESYGGQDPALASIEHEGEVLELSGVAHIDSGFVTLLVQDGVPGLQAQRTDGAWLDVPPEEGVITVNFGKLLETWTGGRIRATRHRVVSRGEERYSIPFFYEPAAEAVIRPLPLDGAEQFSPFTYGDFLWEATTQFVEQKGIAHLRTPRGAPSA